MAPKQQSQGQKDGQHTRRRELSPYTRGQIISASDHGDRIAEISRVFSIPESTIRDTIKNAPTRRHGNSASRSGRSPKLSDRDKRRIIRLVREHPFYTYARVISELDLQVAPVTIRRLLQPLGIKKWIAKKRNLLTKATAQKRLRWCVEHQSWTLERWAQVLEDKTTR